MLLPVVLAARFQESALLCRADGPIRGPADLAGRRIGVRAYSQTTGMWLRGTLADRFALRPEAMRWTTFEDAHVPEYRDPPWAERVPPGSDMLAMLRDGRLDAAIFGNDTPAGDDLRAVFPDPAAAGEAFRAAHGFTPVNHLLVAQRALLEEAPELAPKLVRLFPATAADRAALGPALALAVRYCVEQGLLPRPLAAEEIWAGLPATVA
ncbi:ABC transporter substrate-binding protein [Dankookia sp. P2]|uniref:ABC transporter substrate-binding protein n=1 Tax=Dankookia sp. P2 TaxID=3423955 RepID=UPI003D66EA6A